MVIALLLSAGAAATQSPPVSAGTRAQAQRGEVVYLKFCERCHMIDLRGDSAEEIPDLASDAFLDRWRGMTVAELFLKINRTMPASAPGSLSLPESSDLVAYLLQANGFRAGTDELPADADQLGAARIVTP